MIASGESRSISATLSWSDGNIHPCDISWVSAGGTITQNGLTTAGIVAGTTVIISLVAAWLGVADAVQLNRIITLLPTAWQIHRALKRLESSLETAELRSRVALLEDALARAKSKPGKGKKRRKI